MIKDYIAGKRVRYFKPFQTLFVLAAIYILSAQIIDPKALSAEEDYLKKKENTEVINDVLTKIESKQNESGLKTDTLAAPKDFINFGPIKVQQVKDIDNATPTFIEKVWHLISDWMDKNKAASILLTIPLFALSTKLAFRRKKRDSSYNLTEHIFIQTYIACQCLLVSIIYALLTWSIEFKDLYDIPLFLLFVLFAFDYKQLFNKGWFSTICRTLLMFLYSLLFLIIIAIIIVLLSTLFFVSTGHIKLN